MKLSNLKCPQINIFNGTNDEIEFYNKRHIKKKKTNRVSMENQINKEIRNMIIKTKLVKIVNIK